MKIAKIFRPYIYGQSNVNVRTDHRALWWLQKFKDAEGMLARWLASVTEYDFTIEHREGKKHANVDGCSRIPVRSCPRLDCPDPGHPISNLLAYWGHHDPEMTPLLQNVQVDNATPIPDTRAYMGHIEHHVFATHSQKDSNWLETWSDVQMKTGQSEDPDLKSLSGSKPRKGHPLRKLPWKVVNSRICGLNLTA